MNEHKANESELFEEKINDLMEGRLDADEAQQLKRDAQSDQALAAAIVDAYQLQRAMENIQPERAPDSLRRKLRKIPARSRPLWQRPRWIVAYAAVPLMVFTIVAMQPGTPSQSELDRAHQDLAVAFAYLDRASDRARNQIKADIGGEMTDAVAGSIFKSIYQQNSVMK